MTAQVDPCLAPMFKLWTALARQSHPVGACQMRQLDLKRWTTASSQGRSQPDYALVAQEKKKLRNASFSVVSVVNNGL